jgi:hypothetical protein
VQSVARPFVLGGQGSTVPTSFGIWLPWLPHALPQRWPFCWWLAVVVDHDSRRVMGSAVFKSEPSASDLIRFLGRLRRVVGCLPPYLITDQGSQFSAEALRRWCSRNGVRQRFGAVRYGSIAVVGTAADAAPSPVQGQAVASACARPQVDASEAGRSAPSPSVP